MALRGFYGLPAAALVGASAIALGGDGGASGTAVLRRGCHLLLLLSVLLRNDLTESVTRDLGT